MCVFKANQTLTVPVINYNKSNLVYWLLNVYLNNNHKKWDQGPNTYFGRDHHPKSGLAPETFDENLFIHYVVTAANVADTIFVDGFFNFDTKVHAIYTTQILYVTRISSKKFIITLQRYKNWEFRSFIILK